MKHKTLVKDILGVIGREFKKVLTLHKVECEKGHLESPMVRSNLDGQMYQLEKIRSVIVARYKDKKIPRARKARIKVRG